MRIVVTGGSGKAGRWVVADLREHGHDVLNVDLVPDGSAHGAALVTDLTDLGQALEVTAGCRCGGPPGRDPRARPPPEGETFRVNAMSTYNVFAAAVAAERRAGSSGRRARPCSACRSTAAARSRRSMRRSSPAGELVRAVQAGRRDHGRPVRPAIGHPVRRPAHLEHHGAGRLRRLPRPTGTTRPSGNGTCGATSTCAMSPRPCRSSLEAEVTGAEVCIVAAADTVMTRPAPSCWPRSSRSPAAAAGRRTARRSCRSTRPVGCSATSRSTAGPTTSRLPTDRPLSGRRDARRGCVRSAACRSAPSSHRAGGATPGRSGRPASAAAPAPRTANDGRPGAARSAPCARR